MPEIQNEMLAKLHSHQKTYFNPNRGKASEMACNAALNHYGGYWGPFLM